MGFKQQTGVNYLALPFLLPLDTRLYAAFGVIAGRELDDISILEWSIMRAIMRNICRIDVLDPFKSKNVELLMSHTQVMCSDGLTVLCGLT